MRTRDFRRKQRERIISKIQRDIPYHKESDCINLGIASKTRVQCSCYLCKPHNYGLEPELPVRDRRKLQSEE